MSRICYLCSNPIPEDYKSHRCPDCTRDYQRSWRALNKEKRQAQRRRHRDRHIESEYSRTKVWRQGNPERVAGYRGSRRANQKGCVVSAADILAVVEASGGVCAICRTYVPQEFRHIDHIIPLDKGGPHSQENLQLTCYRCNTSKGAKLPEEVTPEVWVKKPKPGQPFLLNPNWK